MDKFKLHQSNAYLTGMMSAAYTPTLSCSTALSICTPEIQIVKPQPGKSFVIAVFVCIICIFY